MKIDNNSKLIFVDFDGVLNSFEEGSYFTNDDSTYGPSKTICKKLKTLCKKTGAKIIISSNWRKFEINGKYTFKEGTVTNPLRKVYSMYGDYIIGTLPPVRHVTKSEALVKWFEETGYSGRNWVILDDDTRENLAYTEEYDIKNHYIETDREFGITDEIIEKIENLLSLPF